MNRFDADELKAMRRAALALDQSDYEITRRLEGAFDQVSLMLELLHDQSSTDTLLKVDTEIAHLVEKLEDTRTILKLVLRERDLELKLAELDRSPQIEPAEVSYKDRIIDKLKAGERVFEDEEDEGDPLAMDPDTLRRIKQRQQLESLIDSLYTGPAADRIKRVLSRIKAEPRLVGDINVKVTRPYRDLDVQIATAKGRAYENPTNDPK